MSHFNRKESASAQTLESQDPDDIAEIVLRQIKNLRYGSIEILVHDSKVVQIERKEKTRLN